MPYEYKYIPIIGSLYGTNGQIHMDRCFITGKENHLQIIRHQK